MAPSISPTQPWLSLTDLGRLFGISAVSCGRLLIQAGLREPGGQPTDQALRLGLAQPGSGLHRARATVWQRSGCQRALEGQGLVLLSEGRAGDSSERTLVEQWAELLWELKQGSPSIITSAEQMAEDLPQELVGAVNRQLQDKGWDFQVAPCPTQAPARSGQRRPAAAKRSGGHGHGKAGHSGRGGSH